MANFDFNVKSWNAKADEGSRLGSSFDQHRIVINATNYRYIIPPEWEGISDSDGVAAGLEMIFKLDNDSYKVSNANAVTLSFRRKGLTVTDKEIPSIPGIQVDANGGGYTLGINESLIDAVSPETSEHVYELSRLEAFNRLIDQLHTMVGVSSEPSDVYKNNGTSGAKSVFKYSIVSNAVNFSFVVPVMFAYEYLHPSGLGLTDGGIKIYPLCGSALGNYEFKLDADSYATITGDSHTISGLGSGTYNLRIRDADNTGDADFVSPAIDIVLDHTLF